ncbi:MAG: hypothetical protein A3C30_01430 [Candidatus Levybacteria bacterium RIFCSPHIGHO2_02_FULL_40_18]|nr:MAG: hypothetical protein A2869_00995 [Candidatus Levybacteria bacterium RIFCSPHIGHO2_01_FULL_40_58]OGH26658.1 MAG: hypothetical protein A3C30_01430 [Candidatus Levybacteria bacterium RIFCSPHIGHO2_02_FULL_40_18]OGH31187.1 MAG: hypothetical protein A3E43_00265 [Candidatus Levybacteria bacterium RIFCSPHIGHO2_12_FULL_40_31]OGH39869.1 MAG: hypothetical protein A2894_03770 [Candidatus Levybacteria bacterium RIFCSPLOWO2_01_FULL_40_64]OGH48893.1 MAG: hypothetical protein A3I54_04875 [Candidatus Lev
MTSRVEGQRPTVREGQIVAKAKDIRGEMRTAPVLIIAENPAMHEAVKPHPELVEGEGRLKVGPLYGTVWVTTYHQPSERRLQTMTGKDIIGRIGEGEPKTVRALRWNHCQDIETAFRFMGHVGEVYDRRDGKEVQKTKRAIGAMKRIIRDFRSEETMTQERLDSLREATVSDLAQAGFYNARKEVKKQIASQGTLASGRDSEGRINDLVSRSRAASAWLKAIHELMFAGQVREKFPYLRDLVLLERARERLDLEFAVRIIDNVLRLGNNNRDISRTLSSVAHFSRRNLTSNRPKANPYKGPAVIAHVSLFGSRHEGTVRILEAYLGEERARQMLSVPSIIAVYRDTTRSAMGRWEEISERLSAARSELALALEVGDDGLVEAA